MASGIALVNTYLSVRERLSIFERICREWRHYSLQGHGWNENLNFMDFRNEENDVIIRWIKENKTKRLKQWHSYKGVKVLGLRWNVLYVLLEHLNPILNCTHVHTWISSNFRHHIFPKSNLYLINQFPSVVSLACWFYDDAAIIQEFSFPNIPFVSVVEVPRRFSNADMFHIKPPMIPLDGQAMDYDDLDLLELFDSYEKKFPVKNLFPSALFERSLWNFEMPHDRLLSLVFSTSLFGFRKSSALACGRTRIKHFVHKCITPPREWEKMLTALGTELVSMEDYHLTPAETIKLITSATKLVRLRLTLGILPFGGFKNGTNVNLRYLHLYCQRGLRPHGDCACHNAEIVFYLDLPNLLELQITVYGKECVAVLQEFWHNVIKKFSHAKVNCILVENIELNRQQYSLGSSPTQSASC
jgi:hypothetical protein